MTKTEIILALTLGTIAQLVDLNDYAVNTVRDFCSANGYDATALVAEESRRIAECGRLDAYLRVSRVGSHMRCTRRTRLMIWAALESRKVLRAESI